MEVISLDTCRTELLAILRAKSVFHGDFTLSSGAKSKYYIDCRLTTLDAQGAWLAGRLMHALIRREEKSRHLRVDAVGGLTMGADPVALATAMMSYGAKDPTPLRAFCVRKTPKAHGQTKLIEGNFQAGDTVVVMDDVVTRGDSTIAAIQAIKREGGKVAFAAVLVDRQEGGREKIEGLGYPLFSLFKRDELL
ncbi:MAG TPA: orotate phosphoribosyltransferase [Candidatus Saccharimonadales bacterium]|nr:orotate phosphoribosyltransferase [Candidatus Saccharimonadales bacterium]